MIKISNHVNKKNDIYIYKNKYLNAKKNKCDLGIAFDGDVSDKFSIIGKTIDNNIEIAIHQKAGILGLMFHPERKNSSDKIIKKMLKDFL